MVDVYNELAIDLVKEFSMTKFEADKIVKFLMNNGYLDFGYLEEYYRETRDAS